MNDNDAPVPNLSVTPVSGVGDKLNVSWSAPTGVSFSGYSVLWKTKSQTYRRGSRTGSASFLASTTSYQITGLTPGTEYDVLVNALTPSFRVVAGSGTSAHHPCEPGADVFGAVLLLRAGGERRRQRDAGVAGQCVGVGPGRRNTVSYFISDGDPDNKFSVSPAGAVTYHRQRRELRELPAQPRGLRDPGHGVRPDGGGERMEEGRAAPRR